MNDQGRGLQLIFNVLTLILSIVLMFSIIRFVFSGSSISFAGFLEYVSQTPQISVDYEKVFIILGEWPSWANWLRTLINAFCSVLNVLWWICRNVTNVLTVLTYYLFYLFI